MQQMKGVSKAVDLRRRLCCEGYELEEVAGGDRLREGAAGDRAATRADSGRRPQPPMQSVEMNGAEGTGHLQRDRHSDVAFWLGNVVGNIDRGG
jgi:hypothetical protein